MGRLNARGSWPRLRGAFREGERMEIPARLGTGQCRAVQWSTVLGTVQ